MKTQNGTKKKVEFLVTTDDRETATAAGIAISDSLDVNAIVEGWSLRPVADGIFSVQAHVVFALPQEAEPLAREALQAALQVAPTDLVRV